MLFNVEDYPDWIDELYSYFDGDIAVDSRIWDIARQHEEMPHIGNIVATELLSAVVIKMRELPGGQDIDVTYDVNAMATKLWIDSIPFKDGEAIESFIQEKKEKGEKS